MCGTPVACVLLLAVGLTWGRFQLRPGAFLKLPNQSGQFRLNSGTANKAAYDAQEKLLYVVGYNADLLHVVDMNDPSSPQLLDTKTFDSVTQGLPDSVQADSFDPRSVAWNQDCTQLVVTSEGNPHELNAVFEDPPADVEILIPSFGTSVDRKSIPIVETALASAGLRQVFRVCDTGATTVSSRVQDLEPQTVHVDRDNTAYILFSENNGIGKLDLSDPMAQISYFSLGTKDWSGLQFDGAYEDSGINLDNRTVVSFYQPRDLVSFEVDGKVWLATADTGLIRRYSMSSCRFDESVAARSWGQDFSDGLTAAEITKLRAEMNDNTQLGRLRISKLKTPTDGWDPIFQGYDFVSTFGGRGFSILDPTDMTRVYDSGDDFERYFTTADATESEKALYNGNVGSNSQAMSSQFDRRSPELGPTPSAIAVADFNGTQVLVVANGVVGGLYTYSVTSGPVVAFQDFVRRGQPGLSWNEAYARSDDAVGEPYITDLLVIDDQNQKTVVAVSSYAGALSFYSLQETP
ncbi:uncharacterized protein LOC143282561 [Babylonia areolata]|uniref:uncharacterized protein LOC143282561 n=1 Tax=Babylonia areolata TaxID=304850 RepID=UPI003FD3CC78